VRPPPSFPSDKPKATTRDFSEILAQINPILLERKNPHEVLTSRAARREESRLVRSGFCCARDEEEVAASAGGSSK